MLQEVKMNYIKVFLLHKEENQKFKVFKLYDIIDEKEYQRVYSILRRNKIANFKNTDEEFYIGSDQIIYFDLTEDILLS